MLIEFISRFIARASCLAKHLQRVALGEPNKTIQTAATSLLKLTTAVFNAKVCF
jgi:hypothetical protein